MTTRAFTVLFGLILFYSAPVSLAQYSTLELFRAQFLGSNFFAAFMPETSTQWVRVEVSDDLTLWTELANVLTTRQTHGFNIEGEGAKALPRRFYRLVMPGTSAAEARDRWEMLEIQSYSFNFLMARLTASPVTGTVKEIDGEKTVSNVRDLVTGQPVTFDPADFPDIEELFEIIRQGTSPGVTTDCAVIYDEQRAFPANTTFALNGPGWVHYELSAFEVLDSANGAANMRR